MLAVIIMLINWLIALSHSSITAMPLWQSVVMIIFFMLALLWLIVEILRARSRVRAIVRDSN